MLPNQPVISEGNIETRFYKLFKAVQTAVLTEIQLGQFVYEHQYVKKGNSTFDEMARLASVALPEAFGKFIARMDLQNAFLSLGRYVRCFDDAIYVLDKLQALIEDRLMNPNNTADINVAIDQLIECCDQYTNLFSTLE